MYSTPAHSQARPRKCFTLHHPRPPKLGPVEAPQNSSSGSASGHTYALYVVTSALNLIVVKRPKTPTQCWISTEDLALFPLSIQNITSGYSALNIYDQTVVILIDLWSMFIRCFGQQTRPPLPPSVTVMADSVCLNSADIRAITLITSENPATLLPLPESIVEQ